MCPLEWLAPSPVCPHGLPKETMTVVSFLAGCLERALGLH